MTHSIPDSCAVALTTELGTVFVTGDYKFDQTPVDGRPADVSRLAELGREGLLLLCGDSTNADRPGFSPSEREVGPQLEEVFARAEGRIIVTSFASNIHRVQQVVDAAAALGRKVSLVGRSMRKNVNIGGSLGHIEVPDGMLIQPQEVEDWPEHKVVVISTGSQGEPLSALRRMAHNDHRLIKLRRGDTVVFSATPIPGNERAVNETVDRLYHIGCDVITPRDAPIHASGHGYTEELKLMLNLRQAALRDADARRPQADPPARPVGRRGRHRPRRRLPGENGLPLEIDARGAGFGEPEQSGMIFVDGVDIGDPADVALRDRRMLSADGIFIVVATVSEQTGQSVAPTEVIFRGVPFIEQADGLVQRDPGGGRALARSGGHATASGRSTCSSRSSTTTSRRSSTTGCGGVRWCCRSSSRSEAAGPRRRRRLRRRRRRRDPDHEPRAGAVAGACSSVTVPPCDSVTARTIARPSPDPRPPSPAAADEALEHPALDIGRDPGAVVLDDQHRVAVLGRCQRAHVGARRGVPDRVLDQVQRHPVQVVA